VFGTRTEGRLSPYCTLTWVHLDWRIVSTTHCDRPQERASSHWLTPRSGPRGKPSWISCHTTFFLLPPAWFWVVSDGLYRRPFRCGRGSADCPSASSFFLRLPASPSTTPFKGACALPLADQVYKSQKPRSLLSFLIFLFVFEGRSWLWHPRR